MKVYLAYSHAGNSITVENVFKSERKCKEFCRVKNEYLDEHAPDSIVTYFYGPKEVII